MSLLSGMREANQTLAADDIAKYRAELTDLLWEFDDYTELDSFAVEKFSELQTTSRKAAPKIYDILMRMKLDISFRDDMSSRGSVSQLPTPTSPPMVPASLLTLSSGSAFGTGGSGTDFRHVDEATAQMRKLLQQTNFGEAPPPPPSTNPWDWQTKDPGERRSGGEDGESDYTRPGDESPILPDGAPNSEPRRLSYVTPQPTPSITSAPSEHGGDGDGDDHRLSNISAASHNTFGHGFQRQKSVMSTFSIPEDSVSQQNGMIPYFQKTSAFSPVSPQVRQIGMVPPRGSEGTTRSDVESNLPSPSSSFTPLPSLGLSPEAIEAQPGLEVAAFQTSNVTDLGPIPVEPERQASEAQSTSPTLSQARLRQTAQSTHDSVASAEFFNAQCVIDETSSFQISKGFCDGAAEVIRGGIGVKRTKKPVVTNVPTTPCNSSRVLTLDRDSPPRPLLQGASTACMS